MPFRGVTRAFWITTNGDAINAALNRARKAGLFVIALDTALNPPSTADITYATDNFQAGKLIGQAAAAKLNGQKAVIAMLDLFNNQVVSVDIQRDHGFLTGMGINPNSTTVNGKEGRRAATARPVPGRVPPADERRGGRWPAGDGELLVQELRNQRGVLDQRACG
jgi:hypothetical protein